MAKNTQANVIFSNEVFKQYIFQLSTGLVWKNQSRAIANETKDSNERYREELFVLANRGLLVFPVVKSFPRAVLRNIGVEERLIESYASNKEKIPLELRDIAVAEYQKALTSKNHVTGHYSYWDKVNKCWTTIYDEPNNYYRMLMGVPDREDVDFVYNTDPRWDTTTPVHQLPSSTRLEMEAAGVVADLIEKYPDKEYLGYLGRRKIDYFKARVAERFELLWRNICPSSLLNKDWDQCYNNSRLMVINVYYSSAFKRTNDLYDNFLAMAILFMTIQQMQTLYLKADQTRDFYDAESLKVVYDSYSVPFFSEIPLSYHRKIVKNINHLISNKGSDNVFFDLFEIFDLGSMELYNYFLTKRHRFDHEGNPRFSVDWIVEPGIIIDDTWDKQILITDDDGLCLYDEGAANYDEKGRPILKQDDFEWKFSKVKIGSDPALAISDPNNDIEYGVITKPDPYWIEDDYLQKVLDDASINFIESKYIGVRIIFDLMRITFENTFLFRMVTDNQEAISALTFRWPDVGTEASVFDLFIYLAAVYCKGAGYQGIINDRIPAVMDTLGYNFDEAIEILNNALASDEYVASNERLVELINDMEFFTLDSIDDNYNHILEIQNLIIKGYTEAKTIEEFEVYRNLYEALLTSRELTAVYTNPETGEIFDSYVMILDYYNPDLLQRYLFLNDDRDSIEEELDLIIAKLDEIIPSIKYLPASLEIDSSRLIQALYKLLKFFKSAKAELLEPNITYAVRMRGINFFKMLDTVFLYSQECKFTAVQDVHDFVVGIRDIIIHRRDVQQYLDELDSEEDKLYIKDYIDQLTDLIDEYIWRLDGYLKDHQGYEEFIDSISHEYRIADNLRMTDMDRFEVIRDILIDPRYWGLFIDDTAPIFDCIRQYGTLEELFSSVSEFKDNLAEALRDYKYDPIKDRIRWFIDIFHPIKSSTTLESDRIKWFIDIFKQLEEYNKIDDEKSVMQDVLTPINSNRDFPYKDYFRWLIDIFYHHSSINRINESNSIVREDRIELYSDKYSFIDAEFLPRDYLYEKFDDGHVIPVQ